MPGRKDICGNRFGTSFESRRWLSLDIGGSLGIWFSFTIHMFAFVVIVMHLISGSMAATAVFLLLYTPSTIMAIWSLGKAYLTDPGAVPLGARPLVTVKRAQSSQSSTISNDGSDNGNGENGDTNPPQQQSRQQRPQRQQPRQRAIRRCHKCNDNYKPNRAHHDSVTGRCIVKFDHFCPWVGNAVGAKNHKFFVLFVGYTLISCCFSLVLIAMRSVHCGLPSPAISSTTTSANGSSTADNNNSNTTEDRLEECRGWDESYLGLMLFVVSVVFGIFTSCMLCEQIDAIKTNRSKIARMKMSVGEQGTELSRVTEEFNEMFGGTSNQIAWHWFVPLDVEFPRGMDKVVLGYEWDISFEQVPYQEPTHDNNNGNGANASGSRSNTSNSTVRDLEMGTMNNGTHATSTVATNNGPLGSPGGTPTSSRPPSRTPSSSSSSKDKNSDHEVGSGGQKDGLQRVSLDDDGGSSTLVPSASSPQPAKSRSYKVISRHNSRGKLT